MSMTRKLRKKQNNQYKFEFFKKNQSPDLKSHSLLTPNNDNKSKNDIDYIFGGAFNKLFKTDEIESENEETINKIGEIIIKIFENKKNQSEFIELGNLSFEDYSIFKHEDFIGCIHESSLSLVKVYKYDTVKEYFAIPEEKILWEKKFYTV